MNRLRLMLFFVLGITGGAAVVSAENAPVPGADWRDTFAERLYRAWGAGEPMPQLSTAHPDATLDDAYRVQHRFVTRMLTHDRIGGFKAAGVGSDHPDNPTVGVVLASGILEADDGVTIRLADSPPRHIETEIGYVVGRTIDAPLPDIATLTSHIRGLVPVVEAPGYPVEKAGDVTPGDLVAWNINAKEMIIGSLHATAGSDADAVTITLRHNGGVVNEARGSHAVRGQWETLRIAVNRIVQQGYTLEPGHIVTNGALGTILPAEPGDYVADFGPLGRIHFKVE